MSIFETESKSVRSVQNVLVNGKRTSFRLEKIFWQGLRICATERGISVDDLVSEIVNDSHGHGSSMSSAVRVHVVTHFRDKVIKPSG